MTDDDASNESGLCLACGLCCNGVLHARTFVRAEHVALVTRIGLTVTPTGDGRLAFEQPCQVYRENSCLAYAQRPPTCRTFQCSLLQDYQAGAVTLDHSLAIVRAAKALADEAPRDVLSAVSLDVFLTKHFRTA